MLKKAFFFFILVYGDHLGFVCACLLNFVTIGLVSKILRRDRAPCVLPLLDKHVLGVRRAFF